MASRVPTPKRRAGETQKAHAALCDYARMGHGRSLEKLRQAHGKKTVRHYETWSASNDWQERVAEYDAAMQAAADEEAEREMLTGLALPRERVRVLKRIVEFLLNEGDSEDPDDSDGDMAALAGPETNRMVLTLLNPQRLAQLRGVLDDLARETGGRKAGLDVTSGGKEISGVVFTAPGQAPDDEAPPEQ